MKPICITNKGTEIFAGEKGLMSDSVWYRVVKQIGQIETRMTISREQVEALVNREGIKEGAID
jgi:alkylated DNA nucleotide flippase Atl1